MLQLEGERAEKNLEMIRIRANMDRVERATRSVVRGWELVGAGLSAMAAIDGFNVAEQSKRAADREAKEILATPQVKQSSRIVLDPHALPGGVARSVARAPELLLNNLVEEESRELKEDDSEEGISTIEVEETMTLLEDVTASPSIDRVVVREAQVDGNDRHGKQEQWIIEKSASPVEERQASTSTAQYTTSPSHSERVEGASRLQRAASAESLSSFADDEEIQLSDDMDEVGEDDILQSLLRDQKEAAMQENRPTKSRRKRGPTLSPDPSDPISRCSQESGNHSSSDGEYPQTTRSSRRSSARDRKSVNYALPKLNTKMRKPDPADLIPAQGGEGRKGGDSEADINNSNGEATPKRTLKGGSEVASTGNLRELRRQHQSSRIHAEDNDQQESDQIARPAASVTRRRSSSGPQARRSTSMDDHSTTLGGHHSDDEDMMDLSSSWSNGSSTLAMSWKPPTSLGASKSAANGTPIPRNQSGQHIKALKVANRIQKSSVSQPSFNGSEARKVVASRHFIPTSSNGKVLTTSIRLNQPKTATPGSETKRNSLHAAMTWEGQDQSSGFGAA